MRFDALILDMDGVLADTEPVHIRAWDVALEGIPGATEFRSATRLEREKLTGMASAVIAAELIRIFDLPVSADDLVARKRRIYRELIGSVLRPFPGVRDELALLKARLLALATSAPRPEASLVLGMMGFTGVFDPVITSDDVRRTKPAPDCYLLAAERMGVRPQECVVIEDSVHGLRAALDSGATVLAVSPAELPESLAGVRRVFPSTVEALRWLRENGS